MTNLTISSTAVMIMEVFRKIFKIVHFVFPFLVMILTLCLKQKDIFSFLSKKEIIFHHSLQIFISEDVMVLLFQHKKSHKQRLAL